MHYYCPLDLPLPFPTHPLNSVQHLGHLSPVNSSRVHRGTLPPVFLNPVGRDDHDLAFTQTLRRSLASPSTPPSSNTCCGRSLARPCLICEFLRPGTFRFLGCGR
ncbi:hypothetical protein BHE74_00026675 [Ensete ventricosum]|nr:hypothetical protein BHE74_00026675 [Ensete ventricosum]